MRVECVSSVQRERERKVDSKMPRRKQDGFVGKAYVWTQIFSGIFSLFDSMLRFPWQRPYLEPGQTKLARSSRKQSGGHLLHMRHSRGDSVPKQRRKKHCCRLA